ncbi:MAG: hypothetical protein QOF58_2759, partial [Pseudonocardiales bacterium]|nr:hypothetical protein [Pseudonocardiales bacterium]
SDPLSGVAGGSVEIRLKKGKGWRGLKTSVVNGGLTAQIPDGRLSRGRYALRARVIDLAGNERSTRRRVDGKRAIVRLPLRVAARMRAGVRKRVGRRGHKHVRFVQGPRVTHGHRTKLQGRLVSPGGNPLSGVPVEVSSRIDQPGTTFAPVATVRTNRRGRFAYTVPSGRSRVIRFVYRGAPTIRPQTRLVRVKVKAATSIRASRKHVVNGEPVTFTGEVATGPIPATGKLVELQYRDRGSWRTFRSIHTDAAGNWSFEYRFTGTRGTQRYKFRARLPRESGYAYAKGASRPVRVSVKGL